MNRPNWIKKLLSVEQISEISDYVKATENKTMAEIVPVIVHRSSAVRHIPYSISLLLILALVIFEFETNAFLFQWPWMLLWPLILIGCWGLGHLIARSHLVQRFFVPDADEIEQVHQRAHLEFYLNRVNKTKGGTGILIFISVMEKRAVIWADEGVHAKVAPEAWDRILHEMLGRLKVGDWSLALKEAIADCGVILAKHFPPEVTNPNELSNSLVIKD